MPKCKLQSLSRGASDAAITFFTSYCKVNHNKQKKVTRKRGQDYLSESSWERVTSKGQATANLKQILNFYFLEQITENASIFSLEISLSEEDKQKVLLLHPG